MISSNILKKSALFSLLLILTSCSDNAVVRTDKKELENVHCMKLVIFPPDAILKSAAEKLYDFDEKCPYTLSLSQKSGITCNSNYNVDKKTLSTFPSGYIRMDLSKGSQNIFSYYKDLTHKADEDDVKDAFDALKKNLK